MHEECYLIRCMFEVVIAESLSGSLFSDTVYFDIMHMTVDTR